MNETDQSARASLFRAQPKPKSNHPWRHLWRSPPDQKERLEHDRKERERKREERQER